jgi:hypothetical protein
MKVFRRTLHLAILLPALAACGDSTTSEGLAPSDVAQLYELCALNFVPDNPTQPSVDIRSQAFETTNASIRKPQLALDTDRTAGILFTRKGQFVPQEIRGTFTLSGEQVVLRLPSSENPSEYLLPETVWLNFQESPQQLTADATTYAVKRAAYARLAGIPEAGLADQIPGHLTASARLETCN